MTYDLSRDLDRSRFEARAAALTVEEMSRAVDRLKLWAAQEGIYLPEPGDADRLRDIEIEMARMSGWI